MEDNHQPIKNYLHDGDVFDKLSPEESELAFRLQNLLPDDIETIQLIINQYFFELYQWISALLTTQNVLIVTDEEVLSLLKSVFIKAIKQADQFRGQSSVVNWLLEISFDVVKSNRRKIDLQKTNYQDKYKISNTDKKNSSSDEFWDRYFSLPEKLRHPLLLKYLFDKSILDIAQILGIQKKAAQTKLVKARGILLDHPIIPHMGKFIQAYLDGNLDENAEQVNTWESHFEECAECQLAIENYKNFEKECSEQFKRKWNSALPASFSMHSFIQEIHLEISQQENTHKIQIPFRKTAWILAFIFIFVSFAVVFILQTPKESEFLESTPRAHNELPPIVEMDSNTDIPLNKGELSIAPSYIEPDFSSDGNWAALASIQTNQVTGAALPPKIELYDRVNNTFKVIHESVETLNPLISVWNLAPGISADGNLVVFVGITEESGINGSACVTKDLNACLDVFLFDRDTNLTRRITQSAGGEGANGDSLRPTISNDGRWIAFWSLATNLVPETEGGCLGIETTSLCMFVYLYDIQSGSIRKLPVGTTLGESVIDLDRISLSADGRYTGFTISIEGIPITTKPGNWIAFDILGAVSNRQARSGWTDYSYTTEALIYDQMNGDIEKVNVTPQGTLANGASSSPVLSADGRYVAFVSFSTDLVPNDINESSDVFLHDQKTGETVIVSIDSSGNQGNGNSGINQFRKGYDSIDLSNDGKYVIFESNAQNLKLGSDRSCRDTLGDECTNLYLRNVESKQTEFISWIPIGNIVSYPRISSDGHLILFMQSFYNCVPLINICSNLMLYDHQNHWMKNVTNYGEEIPVLPWSYLGSISIPWQFWESTSLSFSPDGKFMAIGGMDSKVRVWSLDKQGIPTNNQTPSIILDSGSNDTFTIIKISDSGKWLAAGTEIGNVYLWKLPEGKLLYKIRQPLEQGVIRRPFGLIKDIAYSTNEKQLVISSISETSIWTMADDALIKLNTYSYGASISITADGTMIALRHEDGTIWIQRIPDGKVIGRLHGANDPLNLTFSGDGKMLAVCSADNLISIWQLLPNDGKSLQISHINTFQSNRCSEGFVFSPDNRYLIFSGNTGEVAVWSVSSGLMFRILNPPINDILYSIAFAENSNVFGAVVFDKIMLWKMQPDEKTNYFVRSGDDKFIDSQPLPKATANDIPQIQDIAFTNGAAHLNLDLASKYLKFPPLIPVRLPNFIDFQEVNINKNGSVVLVYDAGTQQETESKLYIYEKFIDDSEPPTMTLGSTADVIPIQLLTEQGRSVAEYAIGDWYWGQSFTDAIGQLSSGQIHDVWQWDSNSVSQRLRWKQYGILIGIYYQVNKSYSAIMPDAIQPAPEENASFLLNRSDLIQIASSMQWYR